MSEICTFLSFYGVKFEFRFPSSRKHYRNHVRNPELHFYLSSSVSSTVNVIRLETRSTSSKQVDKIQQKEPLSHEFEYPSNGLRQYPQIDYIREENFKENGKEITLVRGIIRSMRFLLNTSKINSSIRTRNDNNHNHHPSLRINDSINSRCLWNSKMTVSYYEEIRNKHNVFCLNYSGSSSIQVCELLFPQTLISRDEWSNGITFEKIRELFSSYDSIFSTNNLHAYSKANEEVNWENDITTTSSKNVVPLLINSPISTCTPLTNSHHRISRIHLEARTQFILPIEFDTSYEDVSIQKGVLLLDVNPESHECHSSKLGKDYVADITLPDYHRTCVVFEQCMMHPRSRNHLFLELSSEMRSQLRQISFSSKKIKQYVDAIMKQLFSVIENTNDEFFCIASDFFDYDDFTITPREYDDDDDDQRGKGKSKVNSTAHVTTLRKHHGSVMEQYKRYHIRCNDILPFLQKIKGIMNNLQKNEDEQRQDRFYSREKKLVSHLMSRISYFLICRDLYHQNVDTRRSLRIPFGKRIVEQQIKFFKKLSATSSFLINSTHNTKNLGEEDFNVEEESREFLLHIHEQEEQLRRGMGLGSNIASTSRISSANIGHQKESSSRLSKVMYPITNVSGRICAAISEGIYSLLAPSATSPHVPWMYDIGSEYNRNIHNVSTETLVYGDGDDDDDERYPRDNERIIRDYQMKVIQGSIKLLDGISQEKFQEFIRQYIEYVYKVFTLGYRPSYPSLDSLHSFVYDSPVGALPSQIYQYIPLSCKPPLTIPTYAVNYDRMMNERQQSISLEKPHNVLPPYCFETWIGFIHLALQRDGLLSFSEFVEQKNPIRFPSDHPSTIQWKTFEAYVARIMCICLTLYVNACEYLQDQIDTNGCISQDDQFDKRWSKKNCVQIEYFSRISITDSGDCEDDAWMMMYQSFILLSMKRYFQKAPPRPIYNSDDTFESSSSSPNHDESYGDHEYYGRDSSLLGWCKPNHVDIKFRSDQSEYQFTISPYVLKTYGVSFSMCKKALFYLSSIRSQYYMFCTLCGVTSPSILDYERVIRSQKQFEQQQQQQHPNHPLEKNTSERKKEEEDLSGDFMGHEFLLAMPRYQFHNMLDSPPYSESEEDKSITYNEPLKEEDDTISSRRLLYNILSRHYDLFKERGAHFMKSDITKGIGLPLLICEGTGFLDPEMVITSSSPSPDIFPFPNDSFKEPMYSTEVSVRSPLYQSILKDYFENTWLENFYFGESQRNEKSNFVKLLKPYHHFDKKDTAFYRLCQSMFTFEFFYRNVNIGEFFFLSNHHQGSTHRYNVDDNIDDSYNECPVRNEYDKNTYGCSFRDLLRESIELSSSSSSYKQNHLSMNADNLSHRGIVSIVGQPIIPKEMMSHIQSVLEDIEPITPLVSCVSSLSLQPNIKEKLHVAPITTNGENIGHRIGRQVDFIGDSLPSQDSLLSHRHHHHHDNEASSNSFPYPWWMTPDEINGIYAPLLLIKDIFKSRVHFLFCGDDHEGIECSEIQHCRTRDSLLAKNGFHRLDYFMRKSEMTPTVMNHFMSIVQRSDSQFPKHKNQQRHYEQQSLLFHDDSNDNRYRSLSNYTGSDEKKIPPVFIDINLEQVCMSRKIDQPMVSYQIICYIKRDSN